ncbi:MAG: hypothetical protein RMJ18_02995, partial [Candidatus Aenigmarchaeota archaeon]|nr:hypothetical protein [Candidatus Aenigmarchaeota archaeon]MDW8160358.1 hypothetical protein [Candidatus Aenigmarchaeota archaeon]
MPMNKKSQEEIKERGIGREEFPKIPLMTAIEYVEKILKKGKEVILREDFEKLIDKHGGRLNIIIKSLKEYGFVISSGKSELMVTDLGKKITKTKNSKEILDVFLSVPIHKKIYDKYGRIIPDKKVLINFLEGKIGKLDAQTLAGLYRESMKAILPTMSTLE